MSKKKFETVEEAVKHIAEVEADLAEEKKAHKATKEQLSKVEQAFEQNDKAYKELLDKEKEAHETAKSNLEAAKNELEEVKKISKEAIDNANAQVKKLDKNVYGTVKGDKYVINFGVDGLSKEELKEDSKKLEKLVKIGSKAITKVK